MNHYCSGIVLGKTKAGLFVVFTDVFGKIIVHIKDRSKFLSLGSVIWFVVSHKSELFFYAEGPVKIQLVPKAPKYNYLEKISSLISFFNSVLPLELPCRKTFLSLQNGVSVLEKKFCYENFVFFEAAWLAHFAFVQGVFVDFSYVLQDLFQAFLDLKKDEDVNCFLLQKINNVEKSYVLIENLVSALKCAF